MNQLVNLFRRISGNHAARNHFKEGIMEMLKQAIDNDDDDILEDARAMYYELRGNGRLLPQANVQQSVEQVCVTDQSISAYTSFETLREAAIDVMLACHRLGMTTVTSYSLFDQVDVEMARRGGWKTGDLTPVPYSGRKGNPRPTWRENLSRVCSQMKIDGELANPATAGRQTYCLGPALLLRLLPAEERSQLQASVDVEPLRTTPLPASEGLPGWQAIE